MGVRRPGGGRKPVEVTQSGIDAALEALVEPVTRGDPDSPLRWTSNSCLALAAELRRQGFLVSHERYGACGMPRITACRPP